MPERVDLKEKISRFSFERVYNEKYVIKIFKYNLVRKFRFIKYYLIFLQSYKAIIFDPRT